MTAPEFDAFIESTVGRYANQYTAAGIWSAEHAEAGLRKELLKLLPQGLATPDQHLLSIESSFGRQVGHLWLNAPVEDGASEAFLCDVVIFDEFRGQGLGRAAMRAAEQWLKDRGSTTVSLHVFVANHAAMHLYETLGYKTRSLTLAKRLLPEPPPGSHR